MDAGVPLTRPVSGVAMGLIQEARQDAVVLTDIQGLEDFLGDMDFKVTGTTKGITAMQMDNKATGLHARDPALRALMQAHEGRAFILDTMLDAIPGPRAESTKETVRRRSSRPCKIPTDKIREVIGSGGKVIRGIQEDTGATIDIQEDGTVFIAGVNGAGDAGGRGRDQGHRQGPRGGRGVHRARRRRHPAPSAPLSKLLRRARMACCTSARVAQGRVDKVEDVLNIGDEVKVRVLEVDEKGKISLDRIDKPEAPAGSGNGGRHHDGEDRRPREHRAPRRRPGDKGEGAGNGGRQPRRHHDA